MEERWNLWQIKLRGRVKRSISKIRRALNTRKNIVKMIHSMTIGTKGCHERDFKSHEHWQEIIRSQLLSNQGCSNKNSC